MIAKRYRLPLGTVAARPQRSVRAGGLTLKIFTTNLPYGRFGVIVPKAVVKTATGRNMLRRAAFDAFAPYVKKTAGRDALLILAKSSPTTKDAMLKELGALLSNL